METKNQLPNLLEMVKGYGKLYKRPLSRLSKNMGMSPNYLSQKLKNPDAPISVLLELSQQLGVNLTEHYVVLLEPALQTTHRERALLIEMIDLKKELTQVKAERDKYWAALEGRVRSQ